MAQGLSHTPRSTASPSEAPTEAGRPGHRRWSRLQSCLCGPLASEVARDRMTKGACRHTHPLVQAQDRSQPRAWARPGLTDPPGPGPPFVPDLSFLTCNWGALEGEMRWFGGSPSMQCPAQVAWTHHQMSWCRVRAWRPLPSLGVLPGEPGGPRKKWPRAWDSSRPDG